MSAPTKNSGRGCPERRTIDNSRAALTWAGAGMSVAFAASVFVGPLALQWALGAWAVAVVLAVAQHHRPPTHEEILADEQWLQAVVDTWSNGRSI